MLDDIPSALIGGNHLAPLTGSACSINSITMTRRELFCACGGAAGTLRAAADDINSEIRRMAAEAPLSMRYTGTDSSSCAAWQRTFRAKLDELLGPYSPPRSWNTVVERTVRLDDHTREELVLHGEGVRPLPLYLLTPADVREGRHAGILALHGHGDTGYDAVAGVARTPAIAEDIRRISYDYGLRLVRQGYVVAVPCLTPFGRRLGDPKVHRNADPCAVTFIRMQALGKLLIAENLRDCLWAFELLARRKEVDGTRLGCVGLSYGGRMTMLTAAMEPRVRAAVVSGALNVLQERVQGTYGCGAQIVPGLLRFGDVPEISSLIAPRPVLWEVGNNDPLMVKSWVGPSWERMRRAWTAFRTEDRLELDRFDGVHEWHGELAYPFLKKHLVS